MKFLNDRRASILRKSGGKIAKHGGFTLLEMIATLAVFAILTGGVALLTQPSINIFTKSTELSRGENICDNVLSLLASEFSYASSIELGSEWRSGESVSGAKSAVYQSADYGEMKFENTEDGIISLALLDGSAQISFDEKLYMGNKLKIGVTRESESVLRLDAVILNRHEKLIGRQKRYVRLLNATVEST